VQRKAQKAQKQIDRENKPSYSVITKGIKVELPFKKEYNQLVTPFAEGKPRIVVSDEMIAKIRKLVEAIIERKRGEAHHRIDYNNEYKRFYTGLLGEAALEQFLGIKIIDWSVGDSSVFNEADLKNSGLDIGIKTVEAWKFPVIHKQVKRPELINVKLDDKTVVFFGYASMSVLRNNQDDNFIISPLLRARGTKTGFYGFSELVEITDFAHLKKVYIKPGQR